jgi:hypothetical protein
MVVVHLAFIQIDPYHHQSLKVSHFLVSLPLLLQALLLFCLQSNLLQNQKEICPQKDLRHCLESLELQTRIKLVFVYPLTLKKFQNQLMLLQMG